jgi:hypothetical protein
MEAMFKGDSRVTVLALAFGLACGRMMSAQQMMPPASSLASADLRLRSLGDPANHGSQMAATDKSYHDSVGPYLPLNALMARRGLPRNLNCTTFGRFPCS